MDKILLNSLNKKILAITLILLLSGHVVQTLYRDARQVQDKHVFGVQASSINTITEAKTDPIQLQFLPVQEIEQVLKEQQLEELYVKSDPNFDQKVENVQKYLERRGAPLSTEARYLVLMANKFQIDYRLLAAISIVESSGGQKLYRRYNAWGWGGSKGFHFENWEHSIYIVSKGLAKYHAKGAVTPEQIGVVYNPHTPNEWAAKVRTLMNQIGPAL